MSKNFLPEYTKRKEEVIYFFEILKKFDLYERKKSGKKLFQFNNYTYADYFKMLRSSFILILYSHLENSVSLFMQELYSHLENESVSYSEVIDNLKNLYLKNLFMDTFKKSASYETYEKKALELVKQTIEDKEIKLTIAKLKISGNINSKIIEEIIENHGFDFPNEYKSQYFKNRSSLDDIKDLRNALAHGRESFKDVGAQKTISDLEKFYSEILKLLDNLKIVVKDFIDNKKYLK